MKKEFVALAILASMAFGSVAQAQVVRSADGDTINVRIGPSISSTIVGTIRGDEGSTLIGQEGAWYKVKLSNGVEGYVADYVTRLTFEDEAMYAVVTTDVLNVRSSPDTGASQLGQIRNGDRVQLHEVRGDWWRIDYQGGAGWILGEYARQEAGAPTPPPDQTPTTPVPRVANGMGVTLKNASGGLRLGPHRDYDVVVWVGATDALTYLGAAEGWVHLALPNGRKGWIHGAEVELWDGKAPWPSGAFYDLKQGRWQIGLLPVRTLTEDYPLRNTPTYSAGNSGVLAAQTTMQILATSGDWLQVQVADGRKGWVPKDVANASEAPTASVENTVLQTVSPGIYRLELTGRLAGATITKTDDGISVLVPDSSGRSGLLDVLDTGISGLKVDARGAHLNMGSLLTFAVVEQTASRLVVRLSPSMTGITHTVQAGNEIYHIAVNGDATASTAIKGTTVTVSLAGTRQTGSVPQNVRTEVRGSNLDIHFTSSLPFALKKVKGGYDAIFYSPTLVGKVIMIDPGHGGFDPGAGYNGLQEAALNLDISLRLRDLLTAMGATVLMTRSDASQALPPELAAGLNPADRSRADLNYRTTLANEQQVDLFVSVHHNASSPGSRGTETYFSSTNMNSASSKLLASMVQAELLRRLGLHDRRVQDNFFYVIKHTQAPAILAEIAFLSDPSDAAFIAIPANRQLAAQAVSNAIGQFFDQGKPPEPDLAELQRRLEQDPTSLAAYEAYFRKAEELGVHQRLDTFIDGKRIDFDVRPFTSDDRTLAPIRALTEAIGAVIKWDPLTQMVTINKGDRVIQLLIGSALATVDGQMVTLDVPAKIVDGRTVVPLRFVSETFGLEVTWMAEFAGIVLTTEAVHPTSA